VDRYEENAILGGNNMSEKEIIQVKSIKKNYGPIEAVKGISFSIREGEFFSLLGPNGSGKTTTISMICTILSMDAGSVEICGYCVGQDDKKIRKLLGVVFQNNRLDSVLTVQENLDIRGKLYGLQKSVLEDRIEELLTITGASDLLKRKYGTLSGGEKRKIDIARALIHSPKILLLDEPTTGLDPESRSKIWHMVTNLRNEENVTILLTTHYLEETNESDHVVVLNEGRVQVAGKPSEIKDRYSHNFLIIHTNHKEELEVMLDDQNMAYKFQDGMFFIPLKNTKEAISIINDCQDLIESYEVKQGTMDDAFMSILRET
jgi:multidrug/hemolysin transport system ATP-binding protein